MNLKTVYSLDFPQRDPDNFWHRIARTEIYNFLESKRLELYQMKKWVKKIQKKNLKKIQKISLAGWAKILGSWNFQDMKVLFIGKWTEDEDEDGYLDKNLWSFEDLWSFVATLICMHLNFLVKMKIFNFKVNPLHVPRIYI